MDPALPHPIPSPPRSDELVIGPGEPMESARHLRQMMLLIDSLEYAWRDRADFFVGGDTWLYFSETQSKRNDFRGPDVMVVLGTTRRERRAWVMWDEDGKAPNVIIELLSETTEHVDRGEKMRIYAQLRVGEYFLFDPFSGVLEGYELNVLQEKYVRKPADEQGRVRCEQMDVSLGKVPGTYHGIEAQWLRWIGTDGAALPLPAERADAEAERADAEAERVRLLQEELAALKASR